MADEVEGPPEKPRKIRPDIVEVRRRVATVSSLLAQGTPTSAVIDWCVNTITAASPERGIAEKTWTVSRQQARIYIDRALEEMSVEDSQPKDRKRARNRSNATMIIQRLMAMNTERSLTAALKGIDLVCKIDGSYDPSSLGPMSPFLPATAEEAATLIDHAKDTLEMARSRGLIAARSAAPRVIDIEPAADELEDEDDEDLVVVPERSGNAN